MLRMTALDHLALRHFLGVTLLELFDRWTVLFHYEGL
jgi:hypothetical protein